MPARQDRTGFAALYESLNGSELIVHDAEHALLYAWDGSWTIEVFDASGANVDSFRFGLFDGNKGNRANQHLIGTAGVRRVRALGLISQRMKLERVERAARLMRRNRQVGANVEASGR